MKFTAYRRLTHHYRNGWKHEDKWDDTPFEFRILSRRHTYEANGECRTDTLRVKGPRLPRKLATALFSSYFCNSCTCEHDCCGHWYVWVDEVKPVNSRKRGRLGRVASEWIVITCASMNC